MALNYEISRTREEEDDIIEALLRLPTRNLESRIRQLEKEIATRQRLSDKVLSTLGTHQLQLKQRLKRLYYIGALGNGFNVKKDCEGQILKLEELIINEMIACFKDMLQLKEKLQEAREELAMDKVKLTLMDIDKYHKNGRSAQNR